MSESAVVKYEPQAPVGSAQNLKGLLERNRASFETLLPKHVTPDRLIKLMLVAANRNPKIMASTQSSVLETVMRASELGLDFGQLGGAHAVPYSNRKTGQTTLQLQIDYRGLVKLIRQSGELEHVDADVVHENDTFVFEKGASPKCQFIPRLTGDRGKILGAYAVLRMRDGGIYADFMDVAAINKVRESSRAKEDGPWVSWWGEMAKKTVLRRCTKLAPMSSEKFERALEYDNLQFDPIREIASEPVPVERIVSRPVTASQALDQIAAKPSVVEPLTPAAMPSADEDDPIWQIPADAEVEDAPETEPPADLFANGPEEPVFQADVKAIERAATKALGKHGVLLVRTFAKDRFKVTDLAKLTEEQALAVDAYIVDSAMAAKG